MVNNSLTPAAVFQDEDEVDQGTMVRAGTGDSGTIRAAGSLASSLGGTARTMIEHDDTGTMQSQLGTMVINSDDDDEEEAGTMKSKTFHIHSHTHNVCPSHTVRILYRVKHIETCYTNRGRHV